MEEIGNSTALTENDASAEQEVVETPDGALFVPTYVPTVEETIKASGGHQQGSVV